MLKNKHISIKNWNADEQPREKFIHKGSNALSNAELLAILINTGTANKSAIDIAREILELAENNLLQLARLQISDLLPIKGLGEKKAVTIAVALEFAKRLQLETSLERPQIKTSKQAVNVLQPYLQHKTHEEIYVLYLNNNACLVKAEKLSTGGITSSVVDVRMILKKALSLATVTNFILAHNHPSGSIKASEPDYIITQKLKKAAEQIDMRLHDHIIIAGEHYYSFADDGKL